MQLLAVVRALECLTRPMPVRVRIDSEHMRKGVTEFLHENYAAPWRKSASEYRRNMSLWIRLAAVTKRHEVEWQWDDGEEGGGADHARAGELARQGLARAQDEASDTGDRGGSSGPAEVIDPLERLAASIGLIKDCNPVAVWERLLTATSNGTVMPDLIANVVEATEAGDSYRAIEEVFAILHDPELADLIVPSRRRSRRDDVATYRIRVNLRGTKPPVWRRLELDSDLFLDDVHEVMQTVFDWTDTHLHKFTSGLSAYSSDAEDYLCPYQVEEGQVGVPEEEVRLDEVLVDVNDKLFYTYDFGDGWKYLIRLEAVLPRVSAAPRAVCTGGRRAGPEEDCGGVDAYESMAEDDPDEDVFELADLEMTNEMLAGLALGSADAKE